MSEQDFDTPPVVNMGELQRTLKGLKESIDGLKESQIPVQQPTTLEPETDDTDIFSNYKEKLIETLKVAGHDTGWRWSSREDNQYFEAIGAASGGSAIPEVWAKDVFRCCPYPASAFLYAPYIKWHDDIKGKPGDTVNVYYTITFAAA